MPALKLSSSNAGRRGLILRILRIVGLVLLGIGAAVLLFFAILWVLLPIVAWFLPAFEPFFYELGAFGVYRTQKYVTFNLTMPRGNVVKWDDSVQDGLVFFAPFGKSISHPGPIIMDTRGELVWASDSYKTTTNFNVQTYKGESYITFWAGNKHGGEGSGAAYLLDSSYNVHKQVHAVGPGLRTDLHEFMLTDDSTALISTINDTTADLTPLGWGRGKDAPIEDSVFQEVDVATGDLIFQWRARDYFKPEDSHFWNPIGGYFKSEPYDFCHLNSVQKDSKGNYLVSSRHLHRLLYIDGKNGDILWTLGSDEADNDFTDLSDGLATKFQWQHHARLVSEKDGIITVMNNGRTKLQVGAPYSEALMLKVDQEERTVELLHSYTSKDKVLAPSQGSVQILPNGNVFVGWGPMAAWSEYDKEGELLYEYHFAASWWFWWERVKNYRTFKVYGWKGEPDYPPAAKIKGKKLYVSWNGATEVKYWKLQGLRQDATAGDDVYDDVETIEKRGFESAFALPRNSKYEDFRVVALDEKRKEIGTSEIAEELGSDTHVGGIIFGILFAIGVAIGIWLIVRYRKRRRQAGQDLGWELPSWGQSKFKYSRLET